MLAALSSPQAPQQQLEAPSSFLLRTANEVLLYMWGCGL
jgi:hypothetical protein